jgi:dihydroneopterin aldolase/2-amino-4-hydroxy-6-hydroxymethyldihydropteridine diphosphokinase
MNARFLPQGPVTEVSLRGLRVRGFHGVLPEEREAGQDFFIDAVLEVPTPETDDLARTADYGELAQRLAAAVAADPVDLIETLAQRLLAICLEAPLVEAATVTVHKPSAPIPLPFDDVTVTVRGQRTPWTVLSLGSNMGDRLAHLQAAVTLLAGEGRRLSVSPVYETDPVGGPDQEPFLNAVAITAAADPFGLWRFTSAIEASRQRERTVRWGPRTLDIDLIEVGGWTLETPELTLPHPRAAERAFVLVPWLDLDPAARLTGIGAVADLVGQMDTSGVRRTDLELRT